MYVCAPCVCVGAQGPKEGMGSTETRLTDGCKLPCVCWLQTWATESSLQLPLHSVKTGFCISPDWLPNQHPAFPSLCRSTLSVPFLSQPCLSYCQDSGFHSLGNGEPAGSSVLPKWAPWFCNSGSFIYCEECSAFFVSLLRVFLAQPSSSSSLKEAAWPFTPFLACFDSGLQTTLHFCEDIVLFLFLFSLTLCFGGDFSDKREIALFKLQFLKPAVPRNALHTLRASLSILVFWVSFSVLIRELNAHLNSVFSGATNANNSMKVRIDQSLSPMDGQAYRRVGNGSPAQCVPRPGRWKLPCISYASKKQKCKNVEKHSNITLAWRQQAAEVLWLRER